MPTELLLTIVGVIIAALLAAIGYFIKRILDKADMIGEDVADIKPKVKILWELRFTEAHSPLALNERGKDILNKSGIKEFIDEKLVGLIEEIKHRNPQNAYQVQEMAREVMFNVKSDKALLPQLEKGAFETGTDVDSVLLVGSVYLRDLALPKFNFRLEDIDGAKPSN